jgi:signal transduction histidine kinase
MLADLCNAAVQQLGYRLAWVGLLRPGDLDVHPVAQAGYEQGYLTTVKITSSDDDARGAGPIGRAVRERRPCICKDISTDPRFAPWRDDALRRGYASSAAIPLLDGGVCIGSFNLYAPEPDGFDDDEIALLEQLAIDLVLGWARLRATSQLEELRGQLEQMARSQTSGEIAAAIAHDLNNLLLVVSLSLQSAQVRHSNEAMTEASLAINMASQLLKPLISLTRRSSLTGGAADVDRILLNIRTLLARLARKAELQFDLGANGRLARISALDIERVVINLVINAAHAVGENGVISVSTSTRKVGPGPLSTATGELPEGDYVDVIVADNGAGIAPDVLPRLFDPHFTTRGERGSGMGLPSALSLVRAAGGALLVESALGEGSRFIAIVPALPILDETV